MLANGIQFFEPRKLNHTSIAFPSCFTFMWKAVTFMSHWYNGNGVSNYEVELPGQLKSIQTRSLILMELGLGENEVSCSTTNSYRGDTDSGERKKKKKSPQR